MIGEETLFIDEYISNFMIEEIVEDTIKNMDSETKEIIQAYCDGINDAR